MESQQRLKSPIAPKNGPWPAFQKPRSEKIHKRPGDRLNCLIAGRIEHMQKTISARSPYTAEVRDFIAANFFVTDVEAIGDDTSLIEQGIVDSTGVLEVVGFLEQTFGIQVDDSDLVPANLDSIGAIAQYIARKKS